MAVTSLAVSRLRVAFWGNPSHKAGARGAVLVSMHGSLERRPAGHVCFLRHGLTPVLWHCRSPIRARGSHNFPKLPWQGREQGLPFPYARISAVARCARPCQHSSATRSADAGCALCQSLPGHQHSGRGHKNGEVFVSRHRANGST